MPDPAPGQSGPPAGGGNAFTRKIGPLPMWAWLAIAVAGILVWAYFSAKKKKAAEAKKKQQEQKNQAGYGAYLVPPYVWTYQAFPPHQEPIPPARQRHPVQHPIHRLPGGAPPPASANGKHDQPPFFIPGGG